MFIIKDMSFIENKVSFTGHRPQKLPWNYNEKCKSCLNFKTDLKKLIICAIKNGYNYFISGMAIGIDLICAETIIELKKDYTNIMLECAIPCLEQTKYWNNEYKVRYENVLKNSDKITYVSKNYSSFCMNKRNKYMVDNSNILLAFWNGENGGTKNTIMYAKQNGVKIKIIDINKYK